jgi:transposase
MTENYNVAAGLDIHKQFMIATVLTISGLKFQQRFERTMQGLLALKYWILEHKCEVVACESTNNFWYQIYDALCDNVTVIVGNPHDMKVLTHKKTDKIDSEIIAKLALKGMVSSSRIMVRHQRDFRNIVRLRHFLVRKRTDLKNRIHNVFDTELFHFSKVLTDIFGKSGRIIMEGIVDGTPSEDIINSLAGQVRNKKEQNVRLLLEQSLSPYAIIQLKHSLEVLKVMDEQIASLTTIATQYACSQYPREYEILMSVPGVGNISAFTILAEIGNFKDFPSGEKLASWIGIVPKVYQSADHNSKRSITKRGSRTLRWILIQIAHAAAKKKTSIFYDFYAFKKEIIGKGKAAVALARKIITIIWHLIVNDELYEDKYARPKKAKKVPTVNIPINFSLEEAIALFCEVTKTLNKPDPQEY